jgi:hypothetical protein
VWQEGGREQEERDGAKIREEDSWLVGESEELIKYVFYIAGSSRGGWSE